MKALFENGKLVLGTDLSPERLAKGGNPSTSGKTIVIDSFSGEPMGDNVPAGLRITCSVTIPNPTYDPKHDYAKDKADRKAAKKTA